MKIAILTSSFPRYQGDYQGNFIRHLARGQVQLGHEVHVICPHIPGAPFHETMEGIFVHRFAYFYPYRYQRMTSESGMYSAVSRSLLAAFQIPLFLASEVWCTWWIVRRCHIDLIHSHWFIPSGLAGAVIAFMGRKPHVVTSHVLDANLFGKFRFFLPILSHIVASADLITTNSRYTKRRIEMLIPVHPPSKVIPMGVTLSESQPVRNKPLAPVILFVGRLIEWKGIDTLIRSMLLVSKSLPGSKLDLVGEGPLHTDLQDLVNDLGLNDTVRFSGRVTDEELARLYSSASVLVLPSRPHKGLVMEGLGVVLLEAMSHGVPVIGSNIGGITDIIENGKNGFLFSCDDETDLGKKIVALLSDEVLAERFRLAAFETIRSRFSWDAISLQFSEVYEQVLAAHSREDAV